MPREEKAKSNNPPGNKYQGGHVYRGVITRPELPSDAMKQLRSLLEDVGRCTLEECQGFFQDPKVCEEAPEKALFVGFNKVIADKKTFKEYEDDASCLYCRLVYHAPYGHPFSELPLHQACRNGVPLQIIQLLVERFPESVWIPNEKGELPLHAACGRYCQRSRHRIDGTLQWHCSCGSVCKRKGGHDLEVIQYLIDIYPEALTVAGKRNCFPLHHAVQSGASLEIIQVLVEAAPQVLQAKRRIGCRASLRSASKITFAYPSSAQGTPLEVAKRGSPSTPCPVEVVQYLKTVTNAPDPALEVAFQKM
ncbi:expressed unknown protein [Seminavis robusta]|uniref:Uncharacterized protein n=1 Tax=Seminavis robusta TaxID=568900 RepID=A0A9N8H4V9_9STRA|nr:expressed unknown protein [Seminavis robusta]|eukprot:Sro59_g034280.1 n/a (307) ;mRNA; f:109980-110900